VRTKYLVVIFCFLFLQNYVMMIILLEYVKQKIERSLNNKIIIIKKFKLNLNVYLNKGIYIIFVTWNKKKKVFT
jgi:hypothetical protein